MTGLISWIQLLADSPVTIQGVAIIFLVSVFVGASGIALYLIEKRRNSTSGEVVVGSGATYNKWIIAVLSIAATSLIGWNISLQRDVTLIQKRMERYVLPRSLTEAQKNAIAAHLRKFDPQTVVMRIIPRNEEAGSYRADLQQALEKGGWPIVQFIYDETAQEGLSINSTEPRPDPAQQTPFDRLNPKKKPVQILVEAFTQAGVAINGGMSSNDARYIGAAITIVIGNRKRDRWAIPPPPPSPQQEPRGERPGDPDMDN